MQEIKNNQNIPVNKGQSFDLETPERIARFYSILAEGWESEYAEYRKKWYELPRSSEVPDYPLLVDLETVSRCNLKCPMCPTVTDEFIKKRVEPFSKGQMEYSLIEKIIDEIAGKVYSLRLSWIGEPTLHPKLINAVSYAKNKGFREVSFLTNGSKLDLEYFIRLAEAGVDIITVSIDGTGDTYNSIRKPLVFEDTLQKLIDIASYKKELGLNKPLIKVQGIWPAIKESGPQIFYDTFNPISDLIAFNPLIDYLHNDKDIVYENDFACSQHYQRVTIGSNGMATMCSNDDFMDSLVGDANIETIHQIWHGARLQSIRDIHKRPNGFKNIEACKACYYPRKAEADEETLINDRVIKIENYVNRSQVVGT